LFFFRDQSSDSDLVRRVEFVLPSLRLTFSQTCSFSSVMAFVNTYAPPHDAVVGDSYGPDPWDLNFMFSVPPAIENDVVKLTPFIPRLHADGFWDVAGASDPELYRFIRRSFASKEDFLDWTRIAQKSSEVCMFLVVDKTKPAFAAEGKNLGGAMAGTMSYITTSKANRVRVHRRIPYSLVLTKFLPQSTEIGFVITLKSAQRTHVTSNAVGLLMKYALNLPSDPTFPGLGMRRVQWTCDSGNKPSLATAKRLGLQFEGTLRWLWILSEASTSGEKPRKDDPAKGSGRHDHYLSMCWDDWEREGRATIQNQMNRRA
jgi:RimJ/RimL family protein N-acetyltransferase